MASLRTRLLLTIFYSWSFQFPVRTDEWIRRLYTDKISQSNQWDADAIVAAIVYLYSHQQLNKEDDFFSPMLNEPTSSLKTIRLERRAAARKKIAEVAPLIRLCRWLPWVLGVAVTGSVAMENARQNDDLDLMIVCSAHRLWLVRPILILFSQLNGRRRTWGREERNSWCFNLWLEPSTLQVPAEQRSLYTAYEVCQTNWLINKADTREWFFRANCWVSTTVPMLYRSAGAQPARFELQTAFFRILILSNCIDLANYLSFIFQLVYMRRHMTRERVKLQMAAFHPRDTKGKILSTMRSMVSEQLFTKSVLVTGVFDVLHQEHLVFLERARALGETLVVGIESDARVQQLKGTARPVHSQAVRKENLEKLGVADEVFVLPEKFDTPADHRKLLAKLRPHVIAVSSHTPHLAEKQQLMQEIGGRVEIVHQHNPAVSSTILLERDRS